MSDHLSNYWIYPGNRSCPVVVYATSEEQARIKVLASPEYDGFGVVQEVRVYRVEEFVLMCERGEAS